MRIFASRYDSTSMETSIKICKRTLLHDATFTAVFLLLFTLCYDFLSQWNRDECVYCFCISMEPANQWCRSCLYTGRRDARACSEQTSGHNRPGHCAIGRLFAIAIRSRRGACPFNKLFAGQSFANRHLFTWTATNRCLLLVRRMHHRLPRPTLMHR